jgi:hypothetical protein
MLKSGIVASALFILFDANAQQFEIDTIVFSGNSDKHLNLVILSDGYTNNELNKFVTDATNFTNVFFDEIPFSNYINYFNIFIIKVPSNESGASHPGTATDVTEPAHPVIVVDNYFGSTFDFYNIHRLLVATKTDVITNVLGANFPEYDQVLILVNTPYYGGSGSNYTIASTHSMSAEIAIHELGHSITWLKDEYWAGDVYAAEGINMTKQTDPSMVKWKNWIGTNGIGIYQHCCGGTSSLWFKPHQECKMQFLGIPFCSVCIQGTIERIHSLITPVESYIPLEKTLTGSPYPLKFKVNLIVPSPNTLKRSWILNGLIIEHNVDSVLINEYNLLKRPNTLQTVIEDTTLLLRVDNHSALHITTVTWTINKNLTGIKEITSSSAEIIIDLYPNPASDHINVRLTGEIRGRIRLEIYDCMGKRLKTSPLQSEEVNLIDLNDIDPGIYFAKILINNNLISSIKIIRK